MATVQEKAIPVIWFFEAKSTVESHHRYRTQYGKDPPSDNATRRWLKQFQETGSVLRLKGAGKPRTSQEDVDRIQEEFSRSPQKSTRRDSFQLIIQQTTVWRDVHSTGNKTFLIRLHIS
jgi:hypothetical protein